MSKTLKPESIWVRPEPTSHQSKLSRPKIAATAIALADAEGFAEVSMRRVAEQLEVSTMSLYHYVKTRAELLALMDDALMAEHLMPKVERGAKGLMAIALRTHEMLMRHPWALLTMRGTLPGPHALKHFEQCLEALAETGLSSKQKLTLLGMVDDVVFGHALRESESRASIDPEMAQRLLGQGEFRQLKKTFSKGPIEADPRRLHRALQAVIGSLLH